jgi:hypothetical protein
MRALLLSALYFAMTLAAATPAKAQASHHVAWSKIELGPWTLTPIYEAQGGTPSEVIGFVALADPEFVVGSNLIAVWYQHSPNGWSAKTWETADPWEAISSVKQGMGISNSEDERWGVPGATSGDPAEQPKDYANGVL